MPDDNHRTEPGNVDADRDHVGRKEQIDGPRFVLSAPRVVRDEKPVFGAVELLSAWVEEGALPGGGVLILETETGEDVSIPVILNHPINIRSSVKNVRLTNIVGISGSLHVVVSEDSSESVTIT